MAFPIDEKYIIESERGLNLIFPNSFKQRMMKCNGGEIIFKGNVWQLHPFFDKLDKKRISRTCNHIIRETIEAKKWAEFPQKAIAIASDSYGNKLILLPKIFNKNKLQEAIFEWNHESGKTIKIANSINAI
jgi:hypothetical protein